MNAAVKWTENMIASALVRQTFDRRHLIIVPRCGWTGSECDLLVVTTDLRVIDVEIKISRADLRADARKDKWFHHWDFRIDGPLTKDTPRRPRDWPHRVWKHYYCLPAEIWNNSLVDSLPSANSGVLLMCDKKPDRYSDGGLRISVARRAKPCRQADRISPEDAVDIARLASLRMWDALKKTGHEVGAK